MVCLEDCGSVVDGICGGFRVFQRLVGVDVDVGGSACCSRVLREFCGRCISTDRRNNRRCVDTYLWPSFQRPVWPCLRQLIRRSMYGFKSDREMSAVVDSSPVGVAFLVGSSTENSLSRRDLVHYLSLKGRCHRCLALWSWCTGHACFSCPVPCLLLLHCSCVASRSHLRRFPSLLLLQHRILPNNQIPTSITCRRAFNNMNIRFA